MKHTQGKVEKSIKKKSIVFIAGILLTVCIIISTSGCENGLQMVPGDGWTPELHAEALNILHKGLIDPNPLIRVNTIEIIAATNQVRLMPSVQRLLQDSSAPVRFAAALGVGDMRYSPAEITIRQMLTDQDGNVRIAAAYALTKLGYERYSEHLRQAITTKDQTVRANVALLLGKSGDRSALNRLYWALRDKDSDDRVVMVAAESIARLGDEQIYSKLWTMLISAYADDRAFGIEAMAALGTEQAKNAIITMLNDNILEVRLTAAQHLGKSGDTIGESKVLEVFKKNVALGMDEQGRERVMVLTALAIGEIRTDTLAGYLPQLLQDPSKFVRLSTAKAVLQCAAKI
jgi:HEAT repeat protein